MKDVCKIVVGFYRLDPDTAFKRHRSRIPISKEVQTVELLKKHLIVFLGLKKLATKYGLESFELKRVTEWPRDPKKQKYLP